jgi:hypothetical protein
MATVEDHCRVFLYVAEQLFHHPGVAGRRKEVEHMDRDAERGARGNGARQHGDRSADLVILAAFEHSLGVVLGPAVVVGQLLVAPRAGELFVGGDEIAHRFALVEQPPRTDEDSERQDIARTFTPDPPRRSRRRSTATSKSRV